MAEAELVAPGRPLFDEARRPWPGYSSPQLDRHASYVVTAFIAGAA